MGGEGKKGRVYTFPLTFGPAPPVSPEQREEDLLSLPAWLETAVASTELSRPTSELVTSIASAGKIVAAISRYPLARLRAGDSLQRYSKAAETAFTGNITLCYDCSVSVKYLQTRSQLGPGAPASSSSETRLSPPSCTAVRAQPSPSLPSSVLTTSSPASLTPPSSSCQTWSGTD